MEEVARQSPPPTSNTRELDMLGPDGKDQAATSLLLFQTMEGAEAAALHAFPRLGGFWSLKGMRAFP